MNCVFYMIKISFDVLSIQVTIFKACFRWVSLDRNVIANAYWLDFSGCVQELWSRQGWIYLPWWVQGHCWEFSIHWFILCLGCWSVSASHSEIENCFLRLSNPQHGKFLRYCSEIIYSSFFEVLFWSKKNYLFIISYTGMYIKDGDLC